MRILFVGGGNMCQAIIGGLFAKGMPATDIHAIEPLAETRAALGRLGIDSASEFHERELDVDVIVLAVKPQVMKSAVAPIAGKLQSQLVLSIAAGIRCVDLAQWLAGAEGKHGFAPACAAGPASYGNIVRAMPNTPALIRAGMTGLYAMGGVSVTSRTAAENLLAAVGKTAWFDDETMLDAVTAVSGSGPAYVFYFIEALEQAARELGFNEPTARQFALQTFLGAARLAADSNESPAILRQRVTSKRGTTERAIDTFDSLALRNHFVAGVKAACQRSRELGDEMSREATAETGKN